MTTWTAQKEFEELARVGSGGGLLYLGTLIQLGAQWVFALVVARALGAEALGLFSLGFAAVQGLSLVALNGLDVGLVRFVSPAFARGDGPRVRSLLWAALMAVLVPSALAAVLLLLFLPGYLGQPAATEGVRQAALLFAPAVVLQSVLMVLASFVFACGRPVTRVLSEKVFGPLTQLVAVAVLLSLGGGLASAVLAYLVGLGLSVATLTYFVAKARPTGRRSISVVGAARELYVFSYRQGVATSITYAFMNGVLFVLAHFSSPRDVGLYTAASRFSLLGLLFLQAFGQAFAPMAARQVDRARLQSAFELVTKWTIVLCAPAVMIMLAFPEAWMGIMGPEFRGGAPVLVVLAAAQLVAVLTGPAGVVLAMRDRPELNLMNNVVVWGGNLLLAVLWVPRFGVVGAAWAYLVAVTAMKVLEFLECALFLHLVPLGRSMLRPLVVLSAAAVPFGVLARSFDWSLPAAMGLSVLFFVLYAVGMWFVGFQRHDLEVVRLMFKGGAEEAARS